MNNINSEISKFEEMIMIIEEVQSQNKLSSIKFIINSIENPLTLFLLELTELEFQKIIKEQKLLINFDDLAKYILNLLVLCNKNDNYIVHIYVSELTEVIFLIEEKVKDKINEKIKLMLRKANDNEIKNYMNKIYLDLRSNYSNIYSLLNEQNIKLEKLNKENTLLSEKINLIENEKNESLAQLLNEKNKEINELNNVHITKDKTKYENDELDRKNMISKYENKISELENKLKILQENSQNLESNNSKNNILKNDIDSKYKILSSQFDNIKNENIKIKAENSQLNKQNLEITKINEELKSKIDILKQEIEESHKNNFDLNIVIDNLKHQLNSNEINIKSLNSQNLSLNEKTENLRAEIIKGNSIIEKLELELKNKKSKIKAIKLTVETQEKLIKEKEDIISSQNKTIDQAKNEKDLKEKQIIELKNKIEEYINKLNENEKLLEENKKMIIYLNKNITDITAAPFNSRTQKQQEFIDKYHNMSGTLFQDHNNIETFEYKTFNNDLNYNNIIEDDLIALPETNFCNYKLSGQLGGTMDKYIIKKNFNNVNYSDELKETYGDCYDNNSILKHKYGNNTTNMSNYFGGNNYENIEYNIMEDYENNNNNQNNIDIQNNN